MTIKAATPYLILNGRADDAVKHYQRALGASVVSLQRFGDMDPNCPEATKNSVMHCVLSVGDATIFLSDGGPGSDEVGVGPISVALSPDDEGETNKAFEVLAESGKVLQPLMKAPWGAIFGAVRDKYGISWMLNCEVKAG